MISASVMEFPVRYGAFRQQLFSRFSRISMNLVVNWVVSKSFCSKWGNSGAKVFASHSIQSSTEVSSAFNDDSGAFFSAKKAKYRHIALAQTIRSVDDCSDVGIQRSGKEGILEDCGASDDE